MGAYGPMGVPFPSKQDIEDGKFDYLLKKEGCQKVWLNRFCLKVEDGKLVPTPELEEIWRRCSGNPPGTSLPKRNRSPAQRFWGSKKRA